MHKDLDTLLSEDLLQVPADFSYRVMHSTKSLPMPLSLVAPRPLQCAQRLLQKFALQLGVVGAGLMGLSQVVSFVLSAWLTTSAL